MKKTNMDFHLRGEKNGFEKNNSKICLLFTLFLVFQSGCFEKKHSEYLKIVIDWNSIINDPNIPLSACEFYAFHGVKLTKGPTEEIINGITYNGMEGYENDDINNAGNLVFNFLIAKVNSDEKISIIYETIVKTKIELKNYLGAVPSLDSYKVGDNVFILAPGNYLFEVGENLRGQEPIL